MPRPPEENYIVEGAIQHETAKAFLIRFTNVDREVWTPKSTIIDYIEVGHTSDGEVLWHFAIKAWFARKEELA